MKPGKSSSDNNAGYARRSRLFIIAIACFFVAILISSFATIARYGGIHNAFSNTYNILRMVGYFSSILIASLVVGLAAILIQKYVIRKRPTFLIIAFFAYTAFSIIAISSHGRPDEAAKLKGNQVLFKNVTITFDDSPSKLDDPKNKVVSYAYQDELVVEVLSISEVTRAFLTQDQQYACIGDLVSGFEKNRDITLLSKKRYLMSDMPALRSEYSSRINPNRQTPLNTVALMKDGWFLFLQLSCESEDYAKYSVFLENIAVGK